MTLQCRDTSIYIHYIYTQTYLYTHSIYTYIYHIAIYCLVWVICSGSRFKIKYAKC